MSTFKVKMQFVFDGSFTISGVDNADQAREYVDKHCGLTIGGDIHSTLPEDQVTWDFTVHPEKRLLKTTLIDKGN